MEIKPEFKNDHDAIITLVAEVRQIRQDLRDMRDGTSYTIKDHDMRINVLENEVKTDNIYYKLIIALGLLIVGLVIWHITGFSI